MNGEMFTLYANADGVVLVAAGQAVALPTDEARRLARALLEASQWSVHMAATKHEPEPAPAPKEPSHV